VINYSVVTLRIAGVCWRITKNLHLHLSLHFIFYLPLSFSILSPSAHRKLCLRHDLYFKKYPIFDVYVLRQSTKSTPYIAKYVNATHLYNCDMYYFALLSWYILWKKMTTRIYDLIPRTIASRSKIKVRTAGPRIILYVAIARLASNPLANLAISLFCDS